MIFLQQLLMVLLAIWGGVHHPEITFNSNGSRLYAIGQINCIITEYSLTTNFDISDMASTGNELDVCAIDPIGRNLVFEKMVKDFTF